MEYKIKNRIDKAYSDYKKMHYNTEAGKMRLSDSLSIMEIAKNERKAKGWNETKIDAYMAVDIAFKSGYAIGYNARKKEEAQNE